MSFLPDIVYPAYPMSHDMKFGSAERSYSVNSRDPTYAAMQQYRSSNFTSDIDHYSFRFDSPVSARDRTNQTSFPRQMEIGSAPRHRTVSVNSHDVSSESQVNVRANSTFVPPYNEGYQLPNISSGFSNLFSLECSPASQWENFPVYADAGYKNCDQYDNFMFNRTQLDFSLQLDSVPDPRKLALSTSFITPNVFVPPEITDIQTSRIQDGSFSTNREMKYLSCHQTTSDNFNYVEQGWTSIEGRSFPCAKETCSPRTYTELNNYFTGPTPFCSLSSSITSSSFSGNTEIQNESYQSATTSDIETTNETGRNSVEDNFQVVSTPEKPRSPPTVSDCNLIAADFDETVSNARSPSSIRNTEVKAEEYDQPAPVEDAGRKSKEHLDHSKSPPALEDGDEKQSNTEIIHLDPSLLPSCDDDKSSVSQQSKEANSETSNCPTPIESDHTTEPEIQVSCSGICAVDPDRKLVSELATSMNSSRSELSTPESPCSSDGEFKSETYEKSATCESEVEMQANTSLETTSDDSAKCVVSATVPNSTFFSSDNHCSSDRELKSEASDQLITIESNMVVKTNTVKTIEPNKCRICKEFLYIQRPVSQQFNVSINPNLDVCSACNICFLQKSNLNLNNGDKKKPHQCSYCARRFTREGNLILHLKIHTGEKPFECSVCNRIFTHKSSLTLHSKIHKCDKPFICSLCGRQFKQKSHLKMHFRFHTGKRKFKCKTCKKCFAIKSNLSEHEKCHVDEKPFKCSACDRRFVRKTCLDQHMRTHTGEKPFQCNNCYKCFSKKSNLTQHYKSCKGENNVSVSDSEN